MAIDPDNLQGIIIYIVSRLNNPQIITEVHFIEKFIPLGARKSVRNLYLEMVGAACSYLLEVEAAKNTFGSIVSQKQELEDCYKASQVGLNSRNVFNSSVAGGARPANSDGTEMEFGEVESWAAICFG